MYCVHCLVHFFGMFLLFKFHFPPRVNVAAAVNVLNTTSKYFCFFLFFLSCFFPLYFKFPYELLPFSVLLERLQMVRILTSALLKSFWLRRKLQWKSSGLDFWFLGHSFEFFSSGKMHRLRILLLQRLTLVLRRHQTSLTCLEWVADRLTRFVLTTVWFGIKVQLRN